MAHVNFTKTQISNKRFVVEWSGLANGDTTEPFDAVEAEAESVTAVNMGTNSVLKQWNGASAPVSGAAERRILVQDGVFVSVASSRWYWTEPSTGVSSGRVAILFREI